MQTFLRIDQNLFMSLVCLIIYFSSRKLAEKRLLHNRIFRWLILTVFCLLILEALTWVLDGAGESVWIDCDYVVTILLFLLTPVPAALWALYVKGQLFHDRTVIWQDLFLYSVPVIICALFTLLSPFSNLMFYFDTAHIYHRGPLYPLLAVVSIYPFLIAIVTATVHRKRVSQRFYHLLALFSLFILAAVAAQVFIYGISVIWSTITITALLTHTNLQNDQAFFDHLTGVFNRRQLDIYLSDRIALVAAGRPLSCILLDVNRFKSINDSLGHTVGDDALKSAACILKTSIRKEDFLSRYGGDEFVVLSDVDDAEQLEKLILRIGETTRAYNETAGKPYAISFSVGYLIYSRDSGMTETEFLDAVDKRMYQDKQSVGSIRADA